ncbi:hypothetical protein Nepgr_026994 [Nepenthes gracilis]|uniref:Uncharacterized protein n=1 Tax=Nepenthes gracilis TaxID=150966 RepID=A0AAD3T9N4_NEPGR|nr:hypothetical protein Nepgr_026994 [Nepenthes gracilis]
MILLNQFCSPPRQSLDVYKACISGVLPEGVVHELPGVDVFRLPPAPEVVSLANNLEDLQGQPNALDALQG